MNLNYLQKLHNDNLLDPNMMTIESVITIE